MANAGGLFARCRVLPLKIGHEVISCLFFLATEEFLLDTFLYYLSPFYCELSPHWLK